MTREELLQRCPKLAELVEDYIVTANLADSEFGCPGEPRGTPREDAEAALDDVLALLSHELAEARRLLEPLQAVVDAALRVNENPWEETLFDLHRAIYQLKNPDAPALAPRKTGAPK